LDKHIDTTNYISKSATEGNVYYNNEDYNDTNKRIIGKLILNEGQPCYRLNEKKWRTFLFEEAGAHHLECELEVFGKFEDDRYSQRGDITYYKLYEDNLGHNFNRFDDEKEKLQKLNVSLYKREFLGIDKSCDEETNIDQDNYTKLRKNQDMEQKLLLAEAVIILSFPVFILVILCFSCCSERIIRSSKFLSTLFYYIFSCLILNLICIICQGVFLGKIIKYDLSYDCSDEKTNEVLRLENLNTKKSIIYTWVNLGLDIFYLLFNVFAHLVFLIMKILDVVELDCCCEIESKDTKISTYNNNRYDFKANEPIREVIPNEGIQNQIEKPEDNNNIDNNINNNNDNFNNLINDLGVPPVISPGLTTDSKL
jgi:hypothetical protein